MSRPSHSQPIIRFPTDEIIQIDLASQNNNDHLPEIPDPLDPQNDLNIRNSVKKLHSGYIVLFHGHSHGQVLSSHGQVMLTPLVWAGVTVICHGDIELVLRIYVICHDIKFMVEEKPWV